MPAALKITLTKEEDRTLKELELSRQVPRRTKQRATALRLNSRGWTVKAIANYLDFDSPDIDAPQESFFSSGDRFLKSFNPYLVVFTHDLDFGTLLAISEVNTPSVIQVRTQDILPCKLGKTVLDALMQFQSELETEALVTINEASSKARILPIKRNS